MSKFANEFSEEMYNLILEGDGDILYSLENWGESYTDLGKQTNGDNEEVFVILFESSDGFVEAFEYDEKEYDEQKEYLIALEEEQNEEGN